jgi:hypothetical protein
VAFAKSIKVDVSADLLKEHSMDEPDALFVESGNQTYAFSCSKVVGDHAMLTLLLDGTKFDAEFTITGSTGVPPSIKLTDCVITKYSVSTGETGGAISDVSGEATSITVVV